MAATGNPSRGARRGSTRRLFELLVVAIAVCTIVGLIALWPGDVDAPVSEGLAADTERAEVTSVTYEACPPPQVGQCGEAEISLETGPDEGDGSTLVVGGTGVEPELVPGDEIRVARSESAGSEPPGAQPQAAPPACSLAVMLATVSLAHGWGPKSLAAMLGTAVSLVLVAVLALAFTNLAHLTGFSSEEATLLLQGGADVSLEGLLLAGIVIAALGVLDDVTVSQASTVLALRKANPGLGFRRLYGHALRVGRDHVSATVNTLVLAYVGASLPVLLIFSSGEIGLIDAINTELIAKEVVGTLVGAIGLIAAVPVTTALAGLLARDLPAEPSRP